jgi:hypothetical protein
MPGRLHDLIRGVTNVGAVQLSYERLTTRMNHPLSSSADGARCAEDPDLTARLPRLHDLALGTRSATATRSYPTRARS